MTMTEKSREQKLRRAAQRQGLIAQKGRSREDGWMIINGWTNAVECGATPDAYCLSLEEAEEYVYSE